MREAQKFKVLIAAIVGQVARWERLSDTLGEICCDGIRHATTVDYRGLPTIADSTVHALEKALKSERRP